MRAIGFSDLKKKDLQILIKDIIETPDSMKITKDSEGTEFVEFTRSFSRNMGIVVRGTYNEEDELEIEYYMPYFNGEKETTSETIDVEKHAEKETYAGICDDPNLGLTLIFFINNVAEFLAAHKKDPLHSKVKGAKLTGLASEGRILLPMEKKKTKSKFSNENRQKLIAEAREGDENAIQNLTLQDMDVYAMLNQRVRKEDLLTIVSTYFMPYGIESDQYGILGDIREVVKKNNILTNEMIYDMEICCNNLIFRVCINEKDLKGEPLPGRRLKANIWMQGVVNN